MINGPAGRRLPLVNHLVEQRLARRLPAVATEVSPRQHDLRGAAVARNAEFAKAAPHPVGEQNRYRRECAIEMALIEFVMRREQPLDEWQIGWRDRPRPHPRRSGRRVTVRGKRHENPSSRQSLGTRKAPHDESDHGVQHVVRSSGVTGVHPESPARMPTEEDGSIAGKRHGRVAREAEAIEPIGKWRGRGRRHRRRDFQGQLHRITRPCAASPRRAGGGRRFPVQRGRPGRSDPRCSGAP